MQIRPFTAPFAVFKATKHPGSRPSASADYWVGVVAERATGKVVWDDGTTTKYGPNTAEDLAFYSNDCLAEDMAAGRLLYAAVQRLMNGNPPVAASLVSSAPHIRSVNKAIKEAENCYKTPPTDQKKDWLVWLEGCIDAADNPGIPFYFPSQKLNHQLTLLPHNSSTPQEGEGSG